MNNLDILRSNAIILKSISQSVLDSFGPNGKSKIIVDSNTKSIIISSDGYVILKYFEIQHPIGNLIKQYFINTRYLLYGGVSSSLLFSSTLFENSLNLIYQGLDINTIIEGYSKALEICLDELNKMEYLEINITYPLDRHQLINIFDTIVQSNLISIDDQQLIKESIITSLLDNNSLIIENENQFKNRIHSLQFTMISNQQQQQQQKVQIINDGLVCEIPTPSSFGKQVFNNATILLLGIPFQQKQIESKFQIQIEFENPLQLFKFKRDEELLFKQYITKWKQELGVNVLISNGEIDPIALHYLDQMGILAISFNNNNQLFEKIAALSNGTIHYSLDPLYSKDSLGKLNQIKIYNNSDDEQDDSNLIIQPSTYYYFKSTLPTTNQNSILLQSNIKLENQQFKRYADDLIMNLLLVLGRKENIYIKGEGYCEETLSKNIYLRASHLSTIHRYPMETFAKSLLVIPNTLQLNSPPINLNFIQENPGPNTTNHSQTLLVEKEAKKENFSTETIHHRCSAFDHLEMKRNILQDSISLVTSLLKVNDILSI
ncbi:hypothetical protein CYY_008192 [Polysphondylium violaceum]|uniref:Uncharacterized protein n=1 Tax=Polysphondylium violaceum TaxID=133409 RepID=A0A8J4PNI1_9MYCE|nr:hypothetical protein CYY_008192 [Polysphondylium violaceum]